MRELEKEIKELRARRKTSAFPESNASHSSLPQEVFVAAQQSRGPRHVFHVGCHHLSALCLARSAFETQFNSDEPLGHS